jgi:hypothetical protein
VQITVVTMPAVSATVTWGRTRLGRTTSRAPLVFARPRDSGPLDLMVRAPGFLPVQTRAHTFEDTKLMVKLTRPDQKSTLLGYRAPLDAGLFDEDGGMLLEIAPPPGSAPLSSPAPVTQSLPQSPPPPPQSPPQPPQSRPQPPQSRPQ